MFKFTPCVIGCFLFDINISYYLSKKKKKNLGWKNLVSESGFNNLGMMWVGFGSVRIKVG